MLTSTEDPQPIGASLTDPLRCSLQQVELWWEISYANSDRGFPSRQSPSYTSFLRSCHSRSRHYHTCFSQLFNIKDSSHTVNKAVRGMKLIIAFVSVLYLNAASQVLTTNDKCFSNVLPAYKCIYRLLLNIRLLFILVLILTSNLTIPFSIHFNVAIWTRKPQIYSQWYCL